MPHIHLHSLSVSIALSLPAFEPTDYAIGVYPGHPCIAFRRVALCARQPELSTAHACMRVALQLYSFLRDCVTCEPPKLIAHSRAARSHVAAQ